MRRKWTLAFVCFFSLSPSSVRRISFFIAWIYCQESLEIRLNSLLFLRHEWIAFGRIVLFHTLSPSLSSYAMKHPKSCSFSFHVRRAKHKNSFPRVHSPLLIEKNKTHRVSTWIKKCSRCPTTFTINCENFLIKTYSLTKNNLLS